MERTPKIEKVNVDGGRFIREAKVTNTARRNINCTKCTIVKILKISWQHYIVFVNVAMFQIYLPKILFLVVTCEIFHSLLLLLYEK